MQAISPVLSIPAAVVSAYVTCVIGYSIPVGLAMWYKRKTMAAEVDMPGEVLDYTTVTVTE